jgi:acetyl-CoA carboxylase biotin carboxylase subunit
MDFRPQTGTIEEYLPPGGPGVRVDSHLYRGYNVPPHYDSLLSKLIVWAPTRSEAIARGRRALNEYVVDGVPTTIPFHLRLLDNEIFQRGDTYTNFLEEHASALALKAQ